MNRQRRHFTPEQKVAVLREHFLDKVPVSDVCEKHGIGVTLFYSWQKLFFENGQAAFTCHDKRRKADTDAKDPKHLRELLRPLAEAGRKQAAQAHSALRGAEVVVDYGKLRREDWLPDGFSFGSGQPGSHGFDAFALSRQHHSGGVLTTNACLQDSDNTKIMLRPRRLLLCPVRVARHSPVNAHGGR